MRISFHGAAREVTGSCHLLEVGDLRILLDCGLVQGGSERHERNREPFPVDPGTLDAVVLSHAHIDHSGRLPLLVRRGFEGPIFATPPTLALCEILLPDSGRIQEEDARDEARRLQESGLDPGWVSPLYTEHEAREALERFEVVEFEGQRAIDGAAFRFLPAGHIFGAAIVELILTEGGGGERRRCRLVFSGDLGVHGARLLGPPVEIDAPDVLVMESTYGDRIREDTDLTEALHGVVSDAVGRGGKVLIPAFAVGRTQEVLARLNDLVEAGRLPRIPTFVDSPMAIAATEMAERHPEAFSREARLRGAFDEPFEFPGLRFTESVEESKEINGVEGSAIIVSASGMCTGGRVKHHLKRVLPDDRSTLLFVGYQAEGTLGRQLQSGASPVEIHGREVDVRASVETIDGFSAHADREELLGWFDAMGEPPGRTFVVHGEEEAALALAEALRDRGAAVDVPRRGDAFEL